MEIQLRPWERLVVHEVIEYRFEDMVSRMALIGRARGGSIPTLMWACGVAFYYTTFPPTDEKAKEAAAGTLRWQDVTFAIKDTYEDQAAHGRATMNLIDESASGFYCDLARWLKGMSKYGS